MKNKLMIDLDLYRYCGDTNFSSKVKRMIDTPGFRFTYLIRKYQFHKENNNLLRMKIFFLILYRYRILYGYEISKDATIGEGFFINHLGPIVVNPKAIIGKNVNIHNGVTIGIENRGKRKGAPKIGDSVWIGANSTIVGNVNVGSNVLIAPNSFINFDVPNNSIVIGNPARIIDKIDATKGYLQNTI